MSNPTVSVVLPTYNRARTLPRAMASVLAQSWRDLELLVVDDGSTDDSAQIVAACPDSRVRYLAQPNRGAAAARNAGVRAAHGRLIAFQDSDDEWLPLKLEKQVGALDAAGADTPLAICGLLRWDTLQISYLPDPARAAARRADFQAEVLRQNFALTSGWCLRREHFLAVGPFDEALPPLEDWEWLIRHSARHHTLVVDEPLAVVYESPDSISSNQARYIQALEGIVERHGAALAARPASLANLYYVLGKKLCLHGDLAQGRRRLLQAMRTHPLDLRASAALGLSLAGRRLFTSIWRSVRRGKGWIIPA